MYFSTDTKSSEQACRETEIKLGVVGTGAEENER
jgi:hypothetical protein